MDRSRSPQPRAGGDEYRRRPPFPSRRRDDHEDYGSDTSDKYSDGKRARKRGREEDSGVGRGEEGRRRAHSRSSSLPRSKRYHDDDYRQQRDRRYREAGGDEAEAAEEEGEEGRRRRGSHRDNLNRDRRSDRRSRSPRSQPKRRDRKYDKEEEKDDIRGDGYSKSHRRRSPYRRYSRSGSEEEEREGNSRDKHRSTKEDRRSRRDRDEDRERDYRDRNRDRDQRSHRHRRDRYDREGEEDEEEDDRRAIARTSSRRDRHEGPRSRAPLPSQQAAFKGEGGEGEEVVEKQRPNFGASGKLAAETNTVAGTDIVLKYHEPAEARKPPAGQAWRLFVFLGGGGGGGGDNNSNGNNSNDAPADTLELGARSCWLFGRERAVADYAIDHPSCSKQHAVLQFRHRERVNEFGDRLGAVKPYLIDLDSANGTRVNGGPVPPSRFVELRSGDVVNFGHSSRDYVLVLPPSASSSSSSIR